MRRKLCFLLGLTLSLAGLPAFAAAPFGHVEGIHGGGNAGGGLLPITGWALDDDGVDDVKLYVDGVIAGRADYGRNRPDVELIFPGYPDGALVGFGMFLDSTRLLQRSPPDLGAGDQQRAASRPGSTRSRSRSTTTPRTSRRSAPSLSRIRAASSTAPATSTTSRRD